MGETIPEHSLAIRMGYWSSIVILISGVGLIGGILASSFLLPTSLTTEWRGIEPYADAYRASGGTITSLSFLAALISCPAYVIQVGCIHRLGLSTKRISAKFGLGFAVMFAALAGLNYTVQLSIVRTRILSGQTEGLDWLVFQNPGSLMLAIDFVGWFFLGLAFLSVVPLFSGNRLNRSIRYLLATIAVLGVVLLVSLATSNSAVGLVFLSTMSALLACADVLILAFFRRLVRV
jgi:hypothetical protein